MSLVDIIKFMVIISVLPSVVLMWMVYKKDRVEKEPVSLIIKLFLLGCFSIIVAGLLESVLDITMQKIIPWSNSQILNFVKAFLVVALIEELVKFLILKLFTWKNKNFNYTFDSIVYAVAIGLGFAAFENILYVFSKGIFVSAVRAVTAIPAHMTFGILMGIYYGRAKVCENKNEYSNKNKDLVKSLLIPIVYHGLYDYCLFDASLLGLILFMVLLVGIYVILFRSVKKYSDSDHLIVEKVNEEEFYEKYMQEDDFTQYNDEDKLF